MKLSKFSRFAMILLDCILPQDVFPDLLAALQHLRSQEREVAVEDIVIGE
jgi:hypothetical protein